MEKNIVVFQAHPDDNEISLGGSLSLLKNKGWDIHIVTLTLGQLGGIKMSVLQTIRERTKEAKAAASIIGASYESVGAIDGALYDTFEMRVKCLDIIRKYKANVVFAHHPYDYHVDHRATAQIVEIACMFSTLENVGFEHPIKSTPLLYHTSTLGCVDHMGKYIKPDFYVNITSEVETKIKMLDCHKSQKELMKTMHGMDNFVKEILKQDETWGSQKESGFGMAEAFYQHLGGAFLKTPLIQQELQDFVKLAK